MIVADQLVAHAVGDYVVQSDWMAQRKVSHSWPAVVHALTYTLPFLFLTRSLAALAVIAGTHFVIDRWRLARFVVWAKNLIAPADWRDPWNEHVAATGYHDDLRLPPGMACTRKQPWMSVWLLIIADNVMHVLINGAALRWLA